MRCKPFRRFAPGVSLNRAVIKPGGDPAEILRSCGVDHRKNSSSFFSICIHYCSFLHILKYFIFLFENRMIIFCTISTQILYYLFCRYVHHQHLCHRYDHHFCYISSMIIFILLTISFIIICWMFIKIKISSCVIYIYS